MTTNFIEFIETAEGVFTAVFSDQGLARLEFPDRKKNSLPVPLGTFAGLRRWLQVTEEAPGKDRQTDDEILDWVKGAAETTYHPIGTCKMGSDPMAVVDSRLRVHGIAGLRVADASIMPTLTSGNTNAPAIMIGEKAADLVLNF